MEEPDGLSIALTGRTYLYSIFHSLLGFEPTNETLAAWSNETTEQALGLFLPIERPAEMVDREAESAFQQDREDPLDQVKNEYTRLFVGPSDLVAPPWESVYMTSERLLFQESTLAVRDAYRSEGFIPAEYPHVADDHIALELDFMARLALRAQDAYERKNESEAVAALKSSESFLSEHLLQWVPLYLAGIRRAANARFYPVVVGRLSKFVAFDKALVEEALSLLDGKEIALH